MRKLAYLCSLMLIFSIPWENSLTVLRLGTFTRGVGILTAVVWVISVFETGNIRKINHILVILLLFILWNISTVFWSIETDETVVRSKTYIQLGIMTLMLWDLYTTQKSLKAALQAYVLGGYVSIFATLFLYLAAGETGMRYAASGFNPNDLSLVLVLGIPLACHLINTKGHGSGVIALRLVNLVYMPAALVVLCLTASRGSLVASFPAILYIAFSIHRYKGAYRWLILIAAAVFIFILLPLIPQSNIERLASINQSVSQFDIGGRTQLWKQSLSVFKEHPVLGAGRGVLSSHNVFLSVMSETGLIGLTIFMIGLSFIFMESLKALKKGELIGLTLFCVWLLGALVHTWEDRKPTWLVFGLIMISGGLLAQKSLRIQSGNAIDMTHTANEGYHKGKHALVK